MAEKLCTLRTKGGGGGAKQTETVLWTNPSPTDSNGFAAQTVTLSDSIDNYDYICVTYGFNHSYTNITSKTHYLVSEFKNLTLGGNVRHYIGQGGAQDASNNTYTREIYYISDTSIGFTTGYGVNKVLSAADVLIPTAIIGIKNMGGWKGSPDLEYVSVTISANATIVIPTTKKAKGFMVYPEASACFYGTQDDEYAYRNGSIASNYPLTFSDNSISLGTKYSSSTAYTFKGVVIY